MKVKIKAMIFFAFGVFFVLNACNVPSDEDPGNNGDVMFTQAAETLAVYLTQTQAANQFPTSPAASTATSSNPTATTAAFPTATKTQVPTESVCDWAAFISDVNIPDGTKLTPGQDFTKVWRLRNIGSCTWTADYTLIFIRGHGMNSTATVPLGETVLPGKTVDVEIDFIAPSDGGEYKGFWMLRNTNGIVFGLGASADQPFWVDVEVVEPNSNYAYDFAINFCEATWSTQELGNMACPGSSSNLDGFVSLLLDPELENKIENEPTIWTHPDANQDGYITGTYPAIEIEDGDHFMAWVGCLADSQGCNLTFYLRYKIDGGEVQTLGTWDEVHDGDVSKIDVDLSSLDGEEVAFIFEVEVNGGKPQNANGFWFVPRIER